MGTLWEYRLEGNLEISIKILKSCPQPSNSMSVQPFLEKCLHMCRNNPKQGCLMFIIGKTEKAQIRMGNG